ncbi:concanavalin A-like lectin/glucanase domain-containing protein, partial [Lactarius psammicola]
DWVTRDDPTHGRVNYVSQAEAQSKNLTYVEGGKFFMRADDWSIVSPSARGRDSIRISSQNTYDEAIFMLDLQHMPAGSNTWPAFWTRGKTGPWPNGGEIDIIEGINLKIHNQAACYPKLHDAPRYIALATDWNSERKNNCGRDTSLTDCNTAANNNAGCGVIFSDPDPFCTSYGAPFNRAGGGYFVTYRGRDSVKVWYYPRHRFAPEVIRVGAPWGVPVYPDIFWGIPAANFPFCPDLCDYEQHFNAHQIIFDLTFCGDWAGSLWPTSGCGAGTCEDFVNDNPSAFADAYWEINSLRVYTPQQSWWWVN